MSQELELLGRTILINKGIYNNSYNYQKLDVVRYNNGSFVAKQATKGHTPVGGDNDNYWYLLGKDRTYTPSLYRDILRFT